MLFLYLLFYKTSSSVSTSHQLLVMVSLVQWEALLWQVWFWIQGHVGIRASDAPNIGCASAVALLQGLEGRGYFMIILVWALRSSIAVVHIGEGLGDSQWQRLQESTGAVRPLWGPHGESCQGSLAPLFFHRVRSGRRGVAELRDGVTQVKFFLPFLMWPFFVLRFLQVVAAS